MAWLDSPTLTHYSQTMITISWLKKIIILRIWSHVRTAEQLLDSAKELENGLTNVELLLAQFASSDGAAFNFKALQREES